MSLADQIAGLDVTNGRSRPGPDPECTARYGGAHVTEENWRAVDDLRKRSSWRFAQIKIDELLEVETPVRLETFRRHWRRQCSCWPEELRA